MFQHTQILKAEITSALDLLPLDSLTLLAEFTAFLRTKVEPPPSSANLTRPLITITTSQRPPVHIVSPRLVHREQLAEFRMAVQLEKENDPI